MLYKLRLQIMLSCTFVYHTDGTSELIKRMRSNAEICSQLETLLVMLASVSHLESEEQLVLWHSIISTKTQHKLFRMQFTNKMTKETCFHSIFKLITFSLLKSISNQLTLLKKKQESLCKNQLTWPLRYKQDPKRLPHNIKHWDCNKKPMVCCKD